jgi:hypothetical protein
MYHSLPVPSQARVLAPLLCVAALAACSPAVPLPNLGEWADHPARAPIVPASASAPGAAEPPPLPFALPEILPRLRRSGERQPSEHLDGTLDGEVWADEAAGAYPRLGPGRQVGVGATLVEKHLLRGTETASIYFVMVKRSPGFDPARGDWEYLVVAPTGEVEQRGRLPLCARCHTDAPHDHLFGALR